MNPTDLAAAAARSKAFNTGILLLAIISFFWGINWPIMKVALDEVPIWMFRAICLAVGGLGLLGIAHMMGHPVRLPRRMLWPIAVVGFFNITVWHVLSAAGIANMAAGRASIIAFTMPLWAALMAAPLLGERLTRLTAVGLVIGLVGLAALLLPDLGGLIADPIGPVFMLIAAASWAAGTIGLKYYRWPMPAIVLAGWQELIGGIPIFIGATIFDSDFVPSAVSTEAWLATAFAAIIPMMLCHWAWFHIVGTFPAVVAAIGTLAIPVVGVISSAIVLGEPIGIDSIAALVLVLTALTVVLIVPALRRRSAGAAT